MHGNVLSCMSTYLKLFCKMILLFLQVEILCVAGRPVALLHTCYQKQWGEGGGIDLFLLAQGVEKL